MSEHTALTGPGAYIRVTIYGISEEYGYACIVEDTNIEGYELGGTVYLSDDGNIRRLTKDGLE